MKLILTPVEKDSLLTLALQYFMESLSCWEHFAEIDGTSYRKAKEQLQKKAKYQHPLETICREDVWSQMILKGKGIKIVDEQDENEFIIFDAKLFNKNFAKCDILNVAKVLDGNGDYDYYTTDDILQSLIFGEVIYG
jgi:hypothetical protein